MAKPTIVPGIARLSRTEKIISKIQRKQIPLGERVKQRARSFVRRIRRF